MNDPDSVPIQSQRIVMADQHEYDTLTRLHHTVHWKPGERKSVKRKYNRRWRKQVRQWAKALG